MMPQEIDAVKSVRHFYHDHPGHGRIRHFKWHRGPLLHNFMGFFHSLIGKICEFNFFILRVYHVLIPGSLFIFSKTDPHAFASGICLVDGFRQQIPVYLRFDSQAGSDIQNRCRRAEGQIKQMEFLSYRQRIYFVSFSFSHHFMIPPINESRAAS